MKSIIHFIFQKYINNNKYYPYNLLFLTKGIKAKKNREWLERVWLFFEDWYKWFLGWILNLFTKKQLRFLYIPGCQQNYIFSTNLLWRWSLKWICLLLHPLNASVPVYLWLISINSNYSSLAFIIFNWLIFIVWLAFACLIEIKYA